ncbi:MAG TPA: ATP-binding protein [Candidatus Limnocylindria bacterium]|jgi:PAS domain S-box-containing protein|nr:ATP-binding protein [Candidatus Limnocylindria bacterium]
MRLQDLPIKRKLAGAIVVTSLAVLSLAGLVLLAYEYYSYRQAVARSLTTVAKVIAGSSSAVLLFDDTKEGKALLSNLRAEPEIVAAALYDDQGHLFATFPTNATAADFPAFPSADGARFNTSRLDLFVPVAEGPRRMGTLFLRQELDGMYDRLGVYGLVLLTVLAGSGLLAFFFSGVFQRTISEPILALAATAKVVSENKDYSVRAATSGKDELGYLTVAFNTMLDQIQASHSALQKSARQLRFVTDNALVFLAQTDRDYRFKFVNRPYAARLGLRPDDIVGKRIPEVVGPEAFESFRHHVDAALNGQRVEFEMEIPYSKLGPRWMYVIYEPERMADGSVTGLVAVASDITERKQVEREIARARDEAVALSRTKDNFLATLSHELRTPLNPALLLASERAIDPALSDALRADFATIRNCVELEAQIIDDLLDHTRISHDKVSLEMRLLEVHTLLQSAIGFVQTEVQQKGIDLRLRFQAHPSHVQGDSVRLQQVFWNVLKNAVKFTPEKGRIEIATSIREGRLFVEISDTGHGMTSDELKRLFTIFSQGDHAEGGGSHRFGGLGLGLAISRRLVELHSGSISASSPGRDLGATIHIDLPLATELEKHSESVVLTHLSPNLAAGAPKVAVRHRILLVEDHEPTRMAMAYLLRRRSYEVVTASTVGQARALAEGGGINLVISDLGLPDGSGNDLMAELSQRHGLQGIALTGYGMEQDIARSQAAGFVAHLTKPVAIQALESAIAKIITVTGVDRGSVG